jgi:biotin carboxyl carrier protein
VTAPLPGVVTVISVKVGDAVKPGQDLCILEAMKMNNPIRATFGGVVKTVYVTIGQQVQHGTPLFLIAD